MSQLPTLSPLQYRHRGDGSIELIGHPDIAVTTHELQSTIQLTNGFPLWEQLAAVRELSNRYVRCILLDASTTRLVDHRRYRPADIQIRPSPFLSLGHTGFLIGLTRYVLLVRHSDGAALGIPDIEVALTTEAEAICPGARILKSWECA